MRMMRHVDLCSGIGGFSLGFEWAGLSRPVMFCDVEPWCRKVLAKHWPDVPIAEDVKELANDPEGTIPECDILTAGYPCQPFSHAGKRRGEADDRHIWPYIREIVARKRPAWCVFENVYGHVSMGLDTVLADLEADGYTTRPFIVPACSVDAAHRRDRVWIVAHTDSVRPQGVGAEPNDARQAGLRCREARGKKGFWAAEPDVCRVAHGIPRRVDRLKGLGNAIVPQVAMQIGVAIRQCEADAIRQSKAKE